MYNKKNGNVILDNRFFFLYGEPPAKFRTQYGVYGEGIYYISYTK